MATLGEVLLTPTTIYARSLLAVRAALVARDWDLHGLAHITGGGLPGNVPRALPDGLGARLDPTRWVMPSVMRLVGALAGHGRRRVACHVQWRSRDDRGRAPGGRADHDHALAEHGLEGGSSARSSSATLAGRTRRDRSIRRGSHGGNRRRPFR